MSPSVSQFEELLSKCTAKEANDLFGVVVAAFDTTGNLLYKSQAGRRSLSTDEGVPFDAFFSCYSVSKPVTTICALQCVERGLISLDDDVSHHLPELAEQPIISAAADGSLCLTPAKKAITLRHLLTHTSGLAYDGQNPLLVRWRKETYNLPPMWKCGDLLKAYSTPRLFEAGESWQYGSSIEWVGLLVSRLNGGIALGKYMEANVFRPVGATDSTFHPGERPDLDKRRLQMVMRNSEGAFQPATENWLYPEDAQDDCGGLGLFSTVPDIVKIIGDLISKSPVLLKAETVDTMFTPQFKTDSGINKGLVNMQFMYGNLIGGSPLNEEDEMNVSFGIGGIVTLRDTPNLPENSLAWGGMPHLAWFINRDLGVGGFIAAQVVPPADAKSNTIIGSFLKEVVQQAKGRAV
ncbi:beta-lactamase/transpeptidase-like protein [Ilyonectria destructans]|nr:beta-lactamase/transpeptidase-like protein [Ilyonectria destructans]